MSVPAKPSPSCFSDQHRISAHDRWLAYERAKKQWDARYPDASTRERGEAFAAIAQRLGVTV